jgi:hypothetical protein
VKRKRQIRRRSARITPAVIELRRQLFALQGAVKACEAARDAAYKRAWKDNRNYTEFHALLPPCGSSCACVQQDAALHAMNRELGMTPWGDDYDELMAEVDQLASQSDAGVEARE